MNRLPIAILLLALASLACLQTTITPEPETEQVFPQTVRPEHFEEPEAGAIYQLDQPNNFPMCAQVSAIVAVNLRNDPGVDAVIIRALAHGELVLIHQQIAGWTSVTTSRGEDGYVKAEYLTESPCQP